MSAQTQGRHKHDFEESDFEFIAPEEDYTVEPDISTADVLVSTAGTEVSTASPEVKTAAESYNTLKSEYAAECSSGFTTAKYLKPTEERELWVGLKRLFEPDDDDTLWKLQRYMHDPLKWKLYDTCDVHHVSTERGHDIFMLFEKDYPLTRALMTLMMSKKLQVDEYSEEHPRCCQAKGLKVKEKLVHLMMVVKFEVLIKKKKMCSLGLMRFDWLMEFLIVHLEELEMKKL
ncbi:hypothetical protein Tco_0718241 [Tanacetum coccineum]